MKFTFAPESRPLEGFTIKRAIYRGGFGEVYYAQSDAGREVALKLLQNNTEIELRGVQQCLNLSHPNLVTIFDVRQDKDGDHWIVMEYVSGETLDTILRRSPKGLPVETVRKWLQGITAGLAYLHSRGLVHRDIKPANVFMENGVVKIGDVGLSKFISMSRHSAQTQSVGTVHYMAPEVAKGRYGREVDIYAMGVVLYEMLTGELPFDGESTGEILLKHLSEPPDLSKLPPRLQGVIGKALQKDPKDRFSCIEALQRAFDDAVLGIHSSPVAVSTPHPAQSDSERSGFATIPATPGSTSKSPNQRYVRLLIGAGLGTFAAYFFARLGFELPKMWLFILLGGMLAYFIGRRKASDTVSKSLAATRLTTVASAPKKLKTSIPSRTSAALGSLFAVVPITAALVLCLAVLKPTQFGTSSRLDSIDPGRVGLFSLVTVISSWAILLMPHLQGTYLSRKKISAFHFALAGAGIGGLAFAIDQYLMIETLGTARNGMFSTLGDHQLVVNGEPSLGGYIAFFATFFGFRNWQEMISPYRSYRLSIMAVLVTVFSAWLATAVFLFPSDLALAWGVVIACVTQLAAPQEERPLQDRRGRKLA